MQLDLRTEYSELRAEIRHYLHRRQSTRHFAYLLTFAVLGSDIATRRLSSWLFVVPPLIILTLWTDEIRRLSAIQRLGTYLRVFVEPNTEGLRYETYALSPSVKLAPISRIIANFDFPVLYLSLCALCLFRFAVDRFPNNVSFWILMAVFALFLCVVFFESFAVMKNGESKHEDNWRDTTNALNEFADRGNQS